MKIVNFKAPGLDKFVRSVFDKSLSVNIRFVKEELKTINIFFEIEGVNRLQSTLLCELKDSYVQQSQRYVNFSTGSFYVPDNIKSLIGSAYNEAEELINDSFKLYKEMIELKDPNKKGRLTADDYKYGIPAEDARMILPLATTTNLTVSMSGDKLFDLVELCRYESYNMHDFISELKNYISPRLIQCIDKYVSHICGEYSESGIINTCTKENNVVCIDSGSGYETVTLGALSSQNELAPHIIYDSWGNEQEEKSKKLINNVIGYGHTAILEQTRSTFNMSCSLSAYHQVIRHRHQNIHRDRLTKLLNITDIDEFHIPESIENSIFYYRVVKLIEKYIRFYENSKTSLPKYFLVFLLNCHPIEFKVSSNARNDNWIFRERLCLTAQSEIREMYEKKFKILYNKYPDIYKYGLPPCILTGKCKEGKLSCGKIRQMQEKYSYVLLDNKK